MQTVNKYGREFERTADGGLIEVGAKLPEGSTARIYDGAFVFKAAAEKMYGGVFHDGVFRGGVFYGGVFHGGVFYGGVFRGGWFGSGEFRGGTFRGGVFHQSPCCAQRSDGYMFVAKYVGDDLRIWAGCRNFSWDEAVAHWNDDHDYGAESQRIIHFLRAQAEAERDRDAERG